MTRRHGREKVLKPETKLCWYITDWRAEAARLGRGGEAERLGVWDEEGSSSFLALTT